MEKLFRSRSEIIDYLQSQVHFDESAARRVVEYAEKHGSFKTDNQAVEIFSKEGLWAVRRQ